MSRKITIRDVAEKAGVSISSVHLALNGKRGVSEETRKEIKRVAEELGYHPNVIASTLKRKSGCIAILVPDVMDKVTGFLSERQEKKARAAAAEAE